MKKKKQLEKITGNKSKLTFFGYCILHTSPNLIPKAKKNFATRAQLHKNAISITGDRGALVAVRDLAIACQCSYFAGTRGEIQHRLQLATDRKIGSPNSVAMSLHCVPILQLGVIASEVLTLHSKSSDLCDTFYPNMHINKKNI